MHIQILGRSGSCTLQGSSLLAVFILVVYTKQGDAFSITVIEGSEHAVGCMKLSDDFQHTVCTTAGFIADIHIGLDS